MAYLVPLMNVASVAGIDVSSAVRRKCNFFSRASHLGSRDSKPRKIAPADDCGVAPSYLDGREPS
jgi:hypothetical protein